MNNGSLVRGCLLLLVSLSLLASGILAAQGGGPAKVGQDDKCPVCGMFVAHFNQWIAEIGFSDGTYRAFDGPKDMFKYYLQMERYEKEHSSSDIAGIYVTDYYQGKLVPAKKALYVVGSDVTGPMGLELVPVVGDEAARTFMRDHHGTEVLEFNQVTLDKIPTMRGGPHH